MARSPTGTSSGSTTFLQSIFRSSFSEKGSKSRNDSFVARKRCLSTSNRYAGTGSGSSMSEALLIFFGPDDDSCHCIHLKEPRDRRNILPYRLHTGKSKKTACKGIYSVAARPARRDSAPGLRQRGWGFFFSLPGTYEHA